jgi:hypothetical protein
MEDHGEGGKDGHNIKQVRFDPAFEVEDEERCRRRLARKEEKKVGSDHNWTIRSSAVIVVAAAVATAVAVAVIETRPPSEIYPNVFCRPAFETFKADKKSSDTYSFHDGRRGSRLAMESLATVL